MAVVASRPATASRRSIRSREGCSTCKRRKVKCDEQRPRCSHCERLNLECKWRPQSSAHHRRQASTAQNLSQHSPVPPSPATDGSPGGSATQQAHAVDEVFDYASFMWDSGDFWQQVSPLLTTANPALGVAALPGAATASQGVSGPRPDEAPDQSMQMPPPQLPAGEDRLMDFFARSDNPPVLAEVETQNKWLAMRQAVVDMARVSPVVRSAILAFSNVLVVRCEGPWAAVSQVYYDNAIRELAAAAAGCPREHLVAALFFLAYVDILESRIDAAHSHLNRAYSVYELADRGSLGHVEKQFFLWFRILDGRAVSAGGDGPFLSKETELMLTEASPASQSLEGEGASTGANADEGGPGSDDLGDGDLDAVLFQVLYQPGIVFYQKVQSFMGRISKIDPWHRSRGTVEDETEVMNVAAEIAADLRSLHDQRPPLMDYAVAGRLTERHVSAHLAFAITRSFRTYLSNYYASKVHLHRVAYKTLPLTREALDALASIRRLARRLVADLAAPDDALPVNMLWPLLMLGVEEQDPEEKAWIRAQILRMEKVASNARITAQVLEEVQARQDAARARMDIRSVMIAVFNSVFAIV
ncbi:fungal-specific transcription factor domain-containing protein [Plectosphaerella plurivora]|uniref:Fungal-specific transcription factor domain-containing protein n=1 Tax=Plectosphaerella plurivora TaxID=936078 RepID=A0A9P8VIR7_9PEZI|nr:fungal-specific transcription factor domain-containing protein [Plectosphaerella plurivora]